MSNVQVMKNVEVANVAGAIVENTENKNKVHVMKEIMNGMETENTENSVLMSKMNTISSDMKLVGSFLEAINKDIAIAQRASFKSNTGVDTCSGETKSGIGEFCGGVVEESFWKKL